MFHLEKNTPPFVSLRLIKIKKFLIGFFQTNIGNEEFLLLKETSLFNAFLTLNNLYSHPINENYHYPMLNQSIDDVIGRRATHWKFLEKHTFSSIN